MRYIANIVLTLLFIACSDSESQIIEDNPYMPIKNLEIPTHVSLGDTVSISGVGFDAECTIEFQMNGSNSSVECKILEVGAEGINLVVPDDCQSGFYVVLLRQLGEQYRIGGINLAGDIYQDSDFELYVLKGATMEMSEASISKQLIDNDVLPESSVKDLDFSGFVIALPNGMVYYTSYGMYVVDGWIKEIHNLGAYNMQTNQKIAPVAVQNLFVIGSIGQDFYVITTDNEYKNYSLIKWNTVAEELVKTFDFSALGGARILSHDQKFHYFEKENVILISGNMGKGDSMAQSAFAIDLESGQIFQVGNNPNYRYAFAPAGDKLYCFATLLDEGDVVKCVVMEISDVRNWSMAGQGAQQVAEIDGMAFDLPVFSPITKKIYGVNDLESFAAIISFDTETNSFESKRWISPGVGGYFFSDVKN